MGEAMELNNQMRMKDLLINKRGHSHPCNDESRKPLGYSIGSGYKGLVGMCWMMFESEDAYDEYLQDYFAELDRR